MNYEFNHIQSDYDMSNVRSQKRNTMTLAQVTRLVMTRVFLWMFGGLLVTAVASALVLKVEAVRRLLFMSPGVFMSVFVIQILLVLAFSVVSSKCSVKLAATLFMVYSFTVGVTFSVLFVVYTQASILVAFASTALIFGAMAAWGYTTKRDLTGIGVVGRMLLIGAIMVSLINVLLYFVAGGAIPWVTMAVNYVLLAVFIGLTAYDMFKIKKVINSPEGFGGNRLQELDDAKIKNLANNIAIRGALELYLDFINIFIRLLAIAGRKR